MLNLWLKYYPLIIVFEPNIGVLFDEIAVATESLLIIIILLNKYKDRNTIFFSI